MDTTKSLERALGLALTTCAANVNALGAGDVLTIETGSYAELGGGTELTAPGYSGDYLIGLDGIRLGEAQTGLPSIDQPWSWTFSPGTTSMHTSTSPINVLSMVGNLVELDFTGWNLNWGGTTQNSSPLGSGAWAGNPEGIAQMQCATDCAYGDT